MLKNIPLLYQNNDDVGTGHYLGWTKGNHNSHDWNLVEGDPDLACKNNICKRYETHLNKGGRYINKQVRCQTCEKFLDIEKIRADIDFIKGIFPNWNEAKCPCCHLKLRTKPRITKLRRRLQDITKVIE